MKINITLFVLYGTLLVLGAMSTGIASSRQGDKAESGLPVVEFVESLRPSVSTQEPMGSRIARLETTQQHVAADLVELKEMLKDHAAKTERIIAEQAHQVERWIIYLFGFLMMGEKGVAIAKRIKG